MLLVDDMPYAAVRQMELNVTNPDIMILFNGAVGDI
jgi:hypothetical protein